MAKKRPLHIRFLQRIRVDTSGCWLWLGAPKANGYGHIVDAAGTSRIVHRVAYELYKGPIEDGLTIDHLCNVKLCVNPQHLEAVTIQENKTRAASRNKYCSRGHLWTTANTYWLPKPQKGRSKVHRSCRDCKKILENISRLIQRAQRKSLGGSPFQPEWERLLSLEQRLQQLLRPQVNG